MARKKPVKQMTANQIARKLGFKPPPWSEGYVNALHNRIAVHQREKAALNCEIERLRCEESRLFKQAALGRIDAERIQAELTKTQAELTKVQGELNDATQLGAAAFRRTDTSFAVIENLAKALGAQS